MRSSFRENSGRGHGVAPCPRPFEETNLLCIYNPGTRQGAIEALTEMCSHLQADETELLALTDSTLAKLRAMTDAEFDELELYPDFDE